MPLQSSHTQPTSSLHKKGSISIVLNGNYYEPYDATSYADQAAAQHRMEFYITWFADPVYLGTDYLSCMRSQLGPRLPTFTSAEFSLLHLSASMNGFYGMNHYTSQFARGRTPPPLPDDWTGNVEELPHNSAGVEIGELSRASWLCVAPLQFRKLLSWIWHRYGLPIYVTENGCPCPGEDKMTLKQAVDDSFRSWYFALYLNAISHAIYEDGVSIRGYYA